MRKPTMPHSRTSKYILDHPRDKMWCSTTKNHRGVFVRKVSLVPRLLPRTYT